MASPDSGGGPGRLSSRIVRVIPALTLVLLLGPVVAGLAGALLPALGLTAEGAANAPFKALFDWPGLGAAIRLSVATGLLATAISLGIVVLLFACWHGTSNLRAMERMLSPLLALPHATAAFGLAFLIAPSGWLARLASPWATGWERPPDLLIVQDPMGLALVAGLVVKEVPFLILMCLSATGQAAGNRGLEVAAALGYRPHAAWLKVVLPRLYPQVRLPVYAVLAYSMTSVDAAMILGPNTPPPLSVQIVRWMNDPDLALRAQAAAAALLQLGLVLLAISLWRFGEIICARIWTRALVSGRRGGRGELLRPLALFLGIITIAAAALGLAGLAIWSVAGFWGFPDPLPGTVSLANWQRYAGSLVEVSETTVVIAAVSTLVSLLLVIGCLEAEYRHGFRLTTRSLWLLYVPLIIPQTAFLPGLQILSIRAGLTSGVIAVTAAHVVFVLPYVFLSLGDPYRAWDGRLGTVAAALGAGPDRILWRLRLPLLLRPVLTAVAVGLAVSVGQYLPTLLVGGGRVATLTTESLALASGGDRRAIGVFGIALTVAVSIPFAIALAIPRIVWRNRRELRHV